MIRLFSLISILLLSLSATAEIETTCQAFPDNLEMCKPFKCQFIHPFTGERMVREIVGEQNSDCVYIEEMPNTGEMKCIYAPDLRNATAKYYRNMATKSVKSIVKISKQQAETLNSVDQIEVENPLQAAIEKGQCVISGY